jgi:hypothetical protein
MEIKDEKGMRLSGSEFIMEPQNGEGLRGR